MLRVLFIRTIPFIIILNIGMINTTFSQNIWTKIYGGLGSDRANSIQQTADGGYIVAGAKEPEQNSNYFDIWIFKTDSLGNLLWSKTYDSNYGGEAYSVQETSDGGYIVTGEIKTDPYFRSDIILLKMDICGSVTWTKTFNFSSYDVAHCVEKSIDEGYIIAGENSTYGAFLIKSNSTGDTLWTKYYGEGSANSVIQLPDGDYLFVGGKWNGDYRMDFWVVKTNNSGDTLWTKTFGYGGLDNWDCAYSVFPTSDNGFVIAGESGQCAKVIKLNYIGQIQWDKTFTVSNGNSSARFVMQLSDHDYLVAGNTQYDLTWLAKFNSTSLDEEFVWIQTYSGFCLSCIQTNDKGFIISGKNDSFGYFGNYADDALLIKTDSLGITTEPSPFGINNKNEMPDNSILIQNYPNPFNSITNIFYIIPTKSDINISIYDIKGNIVQTLYDGPQNEGNYHIKWSAQNISAGIYFIKIAANNYNSVKKCLLIK